MKTYLSQYIARLSALFFLLLCAAPAFAQIRTFKWMDEFCDYSATYNAGKYSTAQIKNTYRLADIASFSLQTSANVFTPGELGTLDVVKLDKEYSALSRELKNLDIADGPYWESLRAAKLEEMKQVYQLERVTILGHTNPKLLYEFPGSDVCKTKYAGPLIAGGDTMLKAWRTLNEASRKNNGDPEGVKRRFESEYASPDRDKYALVEIMNFGWWNCANESVKYVEQDGTQQKEFKKLFIRVRKLSCNEP